MMVPKPGAGELSHLDPQGRVSMVDVGDRPISDREATASGFVRVSDRARAAIAAEYRLLGRLFRAAGGSVRGAAMAVR